MISIKNPFSIGKIVCVYKNKYICAPFLETKVMVAIMFNSNKIINYR